MKQIAYTIGNTATYNKSLEEHPNDSFKMGARKDYSGGCIWKTTEEAKAYLASKPFAELIWDDGKTRDPKNFSVYAVELEQGWEKSVNAKAEGDHYHTLKHDSPFFSLE